MSQIIGITDTSFKAKDGAQIDGKTIYVTDPISDKRGTGLSADHFFLSTKKIAALPFTPAVGQNIVVFFNKFGKVATVQLEPEIE